MMAKGSRRKSAAHLPYQKSNRYMKKKDNIPMAIILVLAAIQAVMLVFSGALCLQVFWLFAPTIASLSFILVYFLVDLIIQLKHSKRSKCPKCKSKWTDMESIFDHCYTCNYEKSKWKAS
jgi:fatty acid desaturase